MILSVLGDIIACNIFWLLSSFSLLPPPLFISLHKPPQEMSTVFFFFLLDSLHTLLTSSALPFLFSLWCTLLGCGCLISTASALHGPWLPSGTAAHTQEDTHRDRHAHSTHLTFHSCCWELACCNLVIGIIGVCSRSCMRVRVQMCGCCTVWRVNLSSLGEHEEGKPLSPWPNLCE